MFNIAIDGTSGAGKSTIANLLAERLGIVYLDTGALYRAVAIKLHSAGAALSDEAKIAAVLSDTWLDIVVGENGGKQRVLLDGEDVTLAIREHFVSKIASDYSAVPAVRQKLLSIQRDIAAARSSILDGRDIGTHVLPNAKYKFFLSASVAVRAKRRYDELMAKGQTVNLTQIEQDIYERDKKDTNRDISPLKAADDAVIVDTSNMSIEEVLEVLLLNIEN